MEKTSNKTKHIGIIACSSEGAALCYRTICSEGTSYLGNHAHPEISIHSFSLAKYVQYLNQGDWNSIGDLMLKSAQKLDKLNADFLICPDNTIHQAVPFIESKLPLPLLNIAEVSAKHASERGFQKLGLTGTKWLIGSDVYPTILAAHDIDFIQPNRKEVTEINRIIMDELVYGKFKNESVHYFQKVMTRMKNEGCDAVVMGCTEIPLIMDDSNSPLPTLDSTLLLAQSALSRAISM